MSFLKLSNLLINTKRIVSIESHVTSYKVIMAHQEISNFFVIGYSQLCHYEICSEKDPKDYKIVEDFITRTGAKAAETSVCT